MLSKAHLKVCGLAASALPPEHQHVISVLWDGVQCGVTLPDEFRAFWDPDEQNGVIRRVLTHRCYVDSDDPRDCGCPIQIARYATGTLAFIADFAAGELEGAYDDDEFRLNCGAYLGVIAHHAGDLWTPVHLGRSLDPATVGFRRRSGLHSRVEADTDRAAEALQTPLSHEPKLTPLDTAHWAALARRLHTQLYLPLPSIYGPAKSPAGVGDFAAGCVMGASQTTADVWYTVLGSSPIAGLRL